MSMHLYFFGVLLSDMFFLFFFAFFGVWDPIYIAIKPNKHILYLPGLLNSPVIPETFSRVTNSVAIGS